MKDKVKIVSFTDLDAWKYAHELVLGVYGLTRLFPKDELFGLTSQIRRSAVSVSSNIAEGFSRAGSKEKLQFYYVAKSSLTEVQNQLLVGRDVGYVSKEKFSMMAELSVRVGKLISGLIRSQKQ